MTRTPNGEECTPFSFSPSLPTAPLSRPGGMSPGVDRLCPVHQRKPPNNGHAPRNRDLLPRGEEQSPASSHPQREPFPARRCHSDHGHPPLSESAFSPLSLLWPHFSSDEISLSRAILRGEVSPRNRLRFIVASPCDSESFSLPGPFLFPFFLVVFPSPRNAPWLRLRVFLVWSTVGSGMVLVADAHLCQSGSLVFFSLLFSPSCCGAPGKGALGPLHCLSWFMSHWDWG